MIISADNEPDNRARTDLSLFLIYSKMISMVCAVRQIVDQQSVKIHPLHGRG